MMSKPQRGSRERDSMPLHCAMDGDSQERRGMWHVELVERALFQTRAKTEIALTHSSQCVPMTAPLLDFFFFI